MKRPAKHPSRAELAKLCMTPNPRVSTTLELDRPVAYAPNNIVVTDGKACLALGWHEDPSTWARPWSDLSTRVATSLRSFIINSTRNDAPRVTLAQLIEWAGEPQGPRLRCANGCKVTRHDDRREYRAPNGDTIEVWWAPKRDVITELRPYTGQLAHIWKSGASIAAFAICRTGMTIDHDDDFVVVSHSGEAS